MNIQFSSIVLVTCFFSFTSIAQKKPKPLPPVSIGKDGKLFYVADSLGNRIPDFSYCGYEASEKPIPEIAAIVFVPFMKGDATARIQAAIDFVASQPIDKDGFKGAVLLDKGVFEVAGQIKITSSGIVIRGSGITVMRTIANGTSSNVASTQGTTLLATGTDRRDLIRIYGKKDQQLQPAIKITNAYVPVNAFEMELTSTANLKKGDKIIIHRPSTQKWLETINTLHFGGGLTTLGWKPFERDLFFHRTITTINKLSITIDAPITTALDSTYGGGSIIPYQWNGKINHIGIENLTCVSTYDKNNLKDEAHAWMGISMEAVEDAWVRRINFQHFAGSAVNLLETTQRITVEDCISMAPISEIGGQRRYTFLTNGQQTLFQRCYAENGYHDFATGFCAPGPNAFVQCESHLPYDFSGAIDSWSSGILFDIVNVDGNALSFGNRGQDGQGAGWAAANSLFWNCVAARIDCYQPPTAQNWAFGSWSQFSGDGYWEASNNTLSPRSFYYAQLVERIGKQSEQQARLLKQDSEASSSPSVEVAAKLTAEAKLPHMQLTEWIELAANDFPISINSKGIKTIDAIGIPKIVAKIKAPKLLIDNGWIIRNNQVFTGRRQEVPWWNGGIQGKELTNAQPAITRFVPGRIGKGLTDDLDAMTDSMLLHHTVGIEQHYALWYERRRDDHERIRRMDGEVWAPFYELPFARSGKELAWDGLSKYDLTKYNSFYWNRMKQFADFADEKGLLLVHQNYFQHNIIEAGAHYADFPWRTANNINETGFPEPVPYAGDKRIFMAEQFYDISNPIRRAIHRAYIRKCLDNFKDNNGVIQLTGEEFTGPLHFVKFWLDIVMEWEKETGKKQIIGLSVTKDVQDAILSNPVYASVVDLIDIRYWHYQQDGTAYAPQGGQNLAPRQHARLLKPKKTSFDQVYHAVSEYRKKYPTKAVMYSSDSSDQLGWAVLMAGGSLPVLPELSKEFLGAIAKMKPMNADGQYILTDGNQSFVVYTQKSIRLDQINKEKQYQIQWLDPKTGATIKEEQLIGAKLNELELTNTSDIIAWIKPI